MIDAELDTMVTTRDGNVVVQIVNGNRLEAEVIFDVEQAIEVGGKMMIAALRAQKEECERELASSRKGIKRIGMVLQ